MKPRIHPFTSAALLVASFTLPTPSFVLRDPPLPCDAPVRQFELNSLFWEPGELSYMREAVAWRAYGAAGVPAPLSYHVVVNQARSIGAVGLGSPHNEVIERAWRDVGRKFPWPAEVGPEGARRRGPHRHAARAGGLADRLTG